MFPAWETVVPSVGIRCSPHGNPPFPFMGTIWKREGAVVDRRHTRYSPDMLACVAYGLLLPPPDTCLRERGRRADTPYVLNAVLSPSSRQGASPPWDRESAADPLSLNIIDFVARTLFYIGRLPNIGNGRADCLRLSVIKMA